MSEEKNRKENIVLFPPCPKCEDGYLVPFSFKNDVFEFWKCTSCEYKINKKD